MKNGYMELEINGKEYGFMFGTYFIEELDKKMPIVQEQIEFGFGLAAKVIPELTMFNTATLRKVLFLANRTEQEKVTQKELADYIDEVEDIEALFELVMNTLEESNSGKLAMLNMKKNLK